MTTREAGIRVTLERGTFQVGMRNMERSAAASGKRMGTQMGGAWSAGLGNVKKTMSGIGASLLRNIKLAVALGGTIATGAMIKGAIDSRVAYLQLADAMESFTGKAMTAADAEALVNRVAAETKVPLADLQGQMMQLAAAAGKVDLEDLLERSASQARRLGMEGEFISRVYTRLVAKGVAKTAEEAENLTEQFNNLFRTMLGVDIDEAIDPMDVAELTAVINTTGNSAAEMLKLISLGGEKISKDFGKTNELVEELGLSLKQSKGVDEMTKKLKIKKGVIDANNSALENMLTIADLGPKKFAAMADALSGDFAGAALKEIVGTEFLVKAELGDVSKKEWDLRIAKLRRQLEDLGDLAVDRKKIEEADARHKDTTSAQLDDAMNKIRVAFSQPKMIAAIEKLATKLPALADAVADLIDWIVENPWTAAMGALTTRIGTAALGGILFGGGGGGVGGFAGAAARGVGGEATGSLAMRMLTGAARGLSGKFKALSNQFGGPGGLINQAGKAAAGLAGAAGAGIALGTLIRKIVVDPALEKGFAERMERGAIGPEAAKAGALKIQERQAAIEEIRRKKAKLVEVDYTDMAGNLERAFGLTAALFDDTADPVKQAITQLETLTKQEKRHQEKLEALWKQEDNAATSAQNLATALDAAAKAAGGETPGGGKKGKPGARGPGKTGSDKPGAETPPG
jgi:hypothetical protein